MWGSHLNKSHPIGFILLQDQSPKIGQKKQQSSMTKAPPVKPIVHFARFSIDLFSFVPDLFKSKIVHYDFKVGQKIVLN